jgi:hypothetical protein
MGPRLTLFALVAVVAASAQHRPGLRARDPASVQFMITNAMKMDLYDLGYTAEDVSRLDPQRAAAILENGIRRPSQGVPAGWTRKGRGGRSRGALATAVGGAVRLAGFGVASALALHFCGMDLGEFSTQVEALLEVLMQSTQSPRR